MTYSAHNIWRLQPQICPFFNHKWSCVTVLSQVVRSFFFFSFYPFKRKIYWRQLTNFSIFYFQFFIFTYLVIHSIPIQSLPFRMRIQWSSAQFNFFPSAHFAVCFLSFSVCLFVIDGFHFISFHWFEHIINTSIIFAMDDEFGI